MLDYGVRAGEAQPGVPVVESDQVGRPAGGAVHLHDLAAVVWLADRVAVHMQPVTDRCLHPQHLLVPVRPGCGPAHTLGLHRSVPTLTVYPD